MFDLNKTIVIANRPIFWVFLIIFLGMASLTGTVLLFLTGLAAIDIFHITDKQGDLALIATFASSGATCLLAGLGFWTIQSQKQMHENVRRRKAEAYRSMAPLALSELNNYCERVADLYNNIFLQAQKRVSIELPTVTVITQDDILIANVATIRFPNESLVDMRKYYEYCSDDKLSVLKEIFNRMQITYSRQRGLYERRDQLNIGHFLNCYCEIALLTCLCNSQFGPLRKQAAQVENGDNGYQNVSDTLFIWKIKELISRDLFNAVQDVPGLLKKYDLIVDTIMTA